jgi:CHAD domain-containing protein
MEKKTWYRPVQGSGIIKSGDLKNILKKSEDPALIECLYLDTADMALLKAGAAFMIVDNCGQLRQMAVFVEGGMEYLTDLPGSGVDLTLFPQDVYQRLCGILNDVPLQVSFVSAFEQKKRILVLEDISACLLVRMLSHFEEGTDQRELCALSLQSMEEGDNAAPAAAHLAAVGALTPCVPPYIEAMRLRSTGCHPAADEKKIKKIAASASAQLLGFRLFELVRAYVALGTGHFEKKSVLKLRVASRKLITLIEAFKEALGDNTASYKEFLYNLIEDTDSLRAIDLLTDEMDTVASMHRDFDFTPLKQRLAEKRDVLCAQLQEAYQKGSYADGLAAFWVQSHKNMHEGFTNEDIINATAKIREWTVELNVYKKAELSDIEHMHTYRKKIRRLRYALECLSEVTVKRTAKATKSCKKLQDDFGMAGDMDSHIKMLQKLSSEENSTQLALLCGVCCGVFAESLPDMHNEAVNTWKDCRNDLKALEDTL